MRSNNIYCLSSHTIEQPYVNKYTTGHLHIVFFVPKEGNPLLHALGAARQLKPATMYGNIPMMMPSRPNKTF